jgi:hypothetical protein
LDTRVEMRGRVLAALGVTSALSSALGGQLLGWLSEATGPRGTLVLAGAVTTIASAAAGVAFATRQNRPLRPAELGRTLLAGVRHVPAAGPVRQSVRQRPARPARLLRPARLAGPRTVGRSTAHAAAAAPVAQRVGAQP